MTTKAFEVVRVKDEGPNRIRAEGRAYEIVRLDDTLVSEGSSSPLRVVEITTYGSSVDVLHAVMTGALLLEGEAIEHVRDAASLNFATGSGRPDAR